MKEEYSPYKIVHHLDKIQALKDGIQPVPLQVQIVPSNICNQRCSFCAYRMKDYPSNQRFIEKDILSYEKILECLDDFKAMGVKAVQYTGGGESLCHPKIKDIFKGTLGRKLDLALVSNGQMLDKETYEILGGATWVRISVDSSSKQMYGMIRNVSDNVFNKVLYNIKQLVRHKKENTIGIGFVVQKENYKGIFVAANMFKDMGVDNFRISAAFNAMGYEYFKDFEKEAKDLSQKAELLTDDNFTVFNLFDDRIKDMFDDIQNYKFCPTKDLLTYIGANYNVYTCCTLAYNDKGYVGSIKDKSFADVWFGLDKVNKFHNHNPSIHCNHSCMYKNKNNFINYCINNNPKHINFI